MSKNTLQFLENDNKELARLSEDIEKVFYSDSNSAVIKSRLFAEKLMLDVISKEKDLGYLNQFTQDQRIRLLNKEGYIDDEIAKCFNNIRIIGNKAVREGTHNDIEYAAKVHKNMYKLAVWYIESYGNDYSVKVPEYTPPEFIKESVVDEKYLDEKLEKKFKMYEEYLKKLNIEQNAIERSDLKTQEEKDIEEAAMKVLGYVYEDELEEEQEDKIVVKNISSEDTEGIAIDVYRYKQSKGSFLLNELEKLSISSKEAVESADGLDKFKQYIHVKRSIQDELLTSIEKAHESKMAQIVLLCGSVGDGKSHLLAYVKENHPQLISGFEVHNDATESFDPNLDEIETLKNVLEPFSDKKIDFSDKKLILAINLGVLHNFLEEDYVKENYKRLIKFVNETGIFEQGITESNQENEHFKLVSFGDYSIFELTENGPKSKYISGLIKKIVEKDESNMFYKAYKKDIENGVVSPILENYKILSMDGVAERISNLIINVIVKYKKIVATREILNFIYEILVPADLGEFDMASTEMDYNKVLLPNILFGCKERGELLKAISLEDPLKYRDEKIDKLLIRLNIATNLNKVVEDYIDNEGIKPLNNILDYVGNFHSINEDLKQEIIDSIIRSLYLVGNSEIKNIFEEPAYKDYMRYLYYYNTGNLRSYVPMFEEVKSAVFKWNGSPDDGYIYLNENIKNYKIAEKLDFEETDEVGVCKIIKKEELERFKNNITLGYEMVLNDGIEKVEIDYQLYKKIVDVNKGYCPNKNDKEEAITFVEFIDKVLTHGDMKKALLIENTSKNEKFKLSYKSITDRFKFERAR